MTNYTTMKNKGIIILVMLLGLLSCYGAAEAQTKVRTKQHTVTLIVKEKGNQDAIIMATCLLNPL